MVVRIVTGLTAMPIVIAAVFYRTGIPFALLSGLASVIALLELYCAMNSAGLRPWKLPGLLAAIVLIQAAFGRDSTGYTGFYAGILTFLFVLTLVLEMARAERKPVANVGATVLGAVYVGWLLSHILRLRSVAGVTEVWLWRSETGAWLVMFVLLATWACDTGAYFAGRYMGKRKLTPRLSPGKTIEGSAGGLMSSIVVAALAGTAIGLPIGHSLLLGALVGIAAQLGDLTASAIKREAGIKDFGTLLPGHGGLLDRIDSLLFTAPLTYYYILAVLPRWLQ